MEKFKLKVTYKHTQEEYENLTFDEVYYKITFLLERFEDIPDPKIKIEIFREYE